MLKTICNEICCSIYILIKFNYRSIPIFSAKVVKGFGFMLKSIDCISQRKKMDALNYPFWKEVILPTTIIANGYFPSALNVKLWKIVFIEKIRALLWCDKPLQILLHQGETSSSYSVHGYQGSAVHGPERNRWRGGGGGGVRETGPANEKTPQDLLRLLEFHWCNRLQLILS